MSLSRYNLFQPSYGLNLFDDILIDNSFRRNYNRFGMNSFTLDMKEQNDKYLIKADLPGLNKSEIKVTFNNGLVNISTQRSESHEDSSEHTHISERSYGSYSRSIRVPDNIDQHSITAQYVDGVLNVTIPKLTPPPSSSRTINVN